MTASESARWLDRFFDHYHRCQPVNATFIGEHRWDFSLPDYSEGSVDDALARIASLLAESPSLSLDALSVDERHDLRLAQGALRIQEWELTGRHFHRGNPSLYTGEAVFGLLSLFLTEYAPLADRVAALADRLETLPRLLDQAKENVEAAPRSWTDRAIRECEGGLALLSDGLPRLVGGVAYLDFLTADDDLETGLEGDLVGFRKRAAAWYRRKLRLTGLVECGLGIWAAKELAPALTAMERAELLGRPKRR